MSGDKFELIVIRNFATNVKGEKRKLETIFNGSSGKSLLNVALGQRCKTGSAVLVINISQL